MVMFKRSGVQKICVVACIAVVSVVVTSLVAVSSTAIPKLRVVIFGGGPTRESNQVAIENNVKWMTSILPEWATNFVMFGDGTTTEPTVQISPLRTKGHVALSYLFGDGPTDVENDTPIAYRKSSLTRVDAPSKRSSIATEFDTMGTAKGNTPVFLYFTGHGSRGATGFDTNRYDLWQEPGITPAELVAELRKLPKSTPVTLLMVQCFSGAFANVIFDDADVTKELLDRKVCGFFAATPDRVAAGCTPELNEAEYRDFSSTFLAALTGKDRVGRSVMMPDYNKNGWVGFEEAYLYSLIEDPSIDVPVVTSDAFLRKFIPVEDDTEVVSTPWADVLKWASQTQRIALTGISDKIGGDALKDNRLEAALLEFRRRGRQGDGRMSVPASVEAAMSGWRTKLLRLFPGLEDGGNSERSRIGRGRAVQYLNTNPEELEQVLSAVKGVQDAQNVAEEDAVRGARWIRLLRLGKSVILEHRMREGKNRDTIKKFEALKKLESGNPLRP